MRFRILLSAALGLSVYLAQPDPLAAQSTSVVREDDRIGRVFSDLEKKIIREVLSGTGVIEDDEDDDADDKTGNGGKNKRAAKGHKGGLPPGLAKRDRLPPGLQKQLDRNGRLPPGLDRRALPEDLEDRLPDRTLSERVIVGDDVVLIEKGTDLVLDVIRDVVRQKTRTSDR